MSVNPEEWDADFAFSNFYLALFNENEADVEIKTLPREKILVNV